MFEAFIIASLMGIAIGLLLLEIFLLPGITVAGVGGALFALGGLFYAYSVSSLVGNLTLGISIIVLLPAASIAERTIVTKSPAL